jgi:hypothetical protein
MPEQNPLVVNGSDPAWAGAEGRLAGSFSADGGNWRIEPDKIAPLRDGLLAKADELEKERRELLRIDFAAPPGPDPFSVAGMKQASDRIQQGLDAIQQYADALKDTARKLDDTLKAYQQSDEAGKHSLDGSHRT